MTTTTAFPARDLASRIDKALAELLVAQSWELNARRYADRSQACGRDQSSVFLPAAR